MPVKMLQWEIWFTGSPIGPFFEKFNILDPEKVRGTNRWKYVTMGFRGQYFDIIMMFRLIGQILRRLNRDLLNVRKPIPKRWSPSDPEDEPFYVLSLAKIDFTSLITFLSILLEKVARLLHNISEGDRPSPIRFSKWRNDIIKGKFLVPDDLRILMTNTSWYDKFDILRNRYTVHYGYSIGSLVISEKTEIQLLSHYNKKQMLYDINDIQKMCDDIYRFFEDLNEFLCNNFDSFPINIRKSR